MKKELLAALVGFALLLLLATPTLAVPPSDSPGKGPPEFDRIVYVHYGENFASKGGAGNKAPQLYSYSGYHWPNDNVSYWVNLDSGRIGEIEAVNGIRASFQTWQDDPNSRIVFTYSGTTDVAPGLNADAADYRNVVGWAYLTDFYPHAVAVTIVWATRGNKHIVDCDTVFNTDSFFAWAQASVTTDPDLALLASTLAFDVDVQNIMTHEAGHWLQLNDLYSSSAIEQTMYGYVGDRELKKRSLETGDLAGVKKIYS